VGETVVARVRPNGARGWARVRRTYAVTLAVVVGYAALVAGLFGLGQLTRWDWLNPWLVVVYALTVLSAVAVWALGYLGLHHGVGIGPLLVGLGLWAALWAGPDTDGGGLWVFCAALALLPGVAALVTHPRRRAQVGSAAR
jgi:hypothetical protein